MEWLEYRKRLGIDFDDEERGAFCTALVLNKLDDLFEINPPGKIFLRLYLILQLYRRRSIEFFVQ